MGLEYYSKLYRGTMLLSLVRVYEGRVMKEKILTDSACEKLTIRWDGVRFFLIHRHKFTSEQEGCMNAIILNPKEMLDLIEFAGRLGRD